MKEQDIQAKILAKLLKEGHWSINVMSASRAGIPDIISCSPAGKFWAIEVKKPGEKPTKLQLYNIKEFAHRGAIAFWCDSYADFLEKFNNPPVW